ncbi:hypothetical protein GGF32_004391 [Allomyces javanicus]|nr:hypothetical protein GGF32_004391 [Allomyces javanicus]
MRKFVANRKKRYGEFEYDVDAEVKQYLEFAAKLKPMVVDTILSTCSSSANAAMLDIDFGTYPYVTSSNTTIGGECPGLSIAPTRLGKVIGVVKAYTTRVGGDPFPTEQLNAVGEHLQTVGVEFGVTTGRKRRCGWLDMVVLRHSQALNGYMCTNLTKFDVLYQLLEIKIGVRYRHTKSGQIVDHFPADLDFLAECDVECETLPGWVTDISKVRHWKDLPKNAQTYVLRIEQLMQGVPIEWVGVGAGLDGGCALYLFTTFAE